MAKFNNKLKKQIDSKGFGLTETKYIAKPNTTNISNHAAHSLDDKLKLVSMLNTLKLQDQYYRKETDTIKSIAELIQKIAQTDVEFIAKAIIYSRCMRDGMRSINHLAAVLLAPYISGKEWAKRFYSKWDKKLQRGGIIFRTDDMSEIMACYKILNPTKSLPNSMKKGFANTIEQLDLYNFGKYTKQIRDIANMVHPNPENTPELAAIPSKGYAQLTTALDWIMKGNNIPADTWERAQSEAGQIVAEAVKSGKLDDTTAVELLKEAKAENWKQLLDEKRLGILAALRNLRNMLKTKMDDESLLNLKNLLINRKNIIEGKIMPYHFDIAYETIKNEFNDGASRNILDILQEAYLSAVPNLAEVLTGKTLIIYDQSGSMYNERGRLRMNNHQLSSYSGNKAIQIAKTIAVATNADVIRFGTNAEYINYSKHDVNVLNTRDSWHKPMGQTNLAKAWILAAESNRKYDRVIILSDYECNVGNTYTAYQNYVNSVGNPYVYQVDLAAYGTVQQVGPKVRYYYGFSYNMLEDIAKIEFNAESIIDEINKIKL